MRSPWTTGHGRPAARRAAAVVELAFLAPIFGALMLGMFELSRAMMVKQQLTAAARKGARTGILHQYGNSDINGDVQNIMTDAGFTAAQFNPPTVGSITITVTDPDGNTLTDSLDAPSGSTVSVKVSIPVSSTTWGSTVYLSSGVIESDTVVMMKQ
jgi:Flp pilus assembly protein TadG